MPNLSDLIKFVTLTATQTLTNKTLTSPTITGGSIDNTPIGQTTAAAINGTTASLVNANVTPGAWDAAGFTLTDPDARNMVIKTPSSSGAAEPYRFRTNNSFVFTVDSTDALHVQASGRVEIPNVDINGGSISGITDLAVSDGGTGASTASGARSNLGVAIGTNVQAWDADLDTWATKTAPSGAVVGTFDNQTLSNKTISGGTFSGDSNFDSATLFVDASTNRVGVGDSTPSYTLDVAGTLRGTGYIYATGSTSSTGLFTGGKTSPALGTVGCEVRGDGVIIATTDATNCMALNRKTNDGTLVSFYQDGTGEGSISVSGTTVSYNNFMGAHYSELDVGNNPLELPRGTIVEATGNLVSQRHTRQQRLSKFKPSDMAASKAVYGVIDGPAYQEGDGYPGQKGFEGRNPVRRQYNIAAVGAGFIRIAAGATVNVGDLIESAGDGTGRVQADDVIRSSTVGKMTSADILETYADGSTLRPCVLYCG